MSQAAARGRFHGMAQVVAFNWPLYGAGLATTVAALTVPRSGRLPPMVRAGARVCGAVAAGWAASSLAVTHLVYDRSELSRWTWLGDLLPTPPTTWVNVHAGFDETSVPLRALLGSGLTVDLYDPEVMTEGSLRRARRREPGPSDALRGRHDELPLEDASVDATFLIFAAHELRGPAQRQALFAEMARVLRPDGRVVLVEHLRDAPNLLAFGPGALHFFPRAEWVRAVSAGDLRVVAERPITPFVRAFALERA